MPEAAKESEARTLAWRLGFLYVTLFLIIGCYLPYLPVWMKWRGLSADEIAILLATPLFGRILIAPSISFVADRIGDRRCVLMLAATGSLISYAALWFSSGFWQLFLAMVLVALASTALMPLTETLAITGIRRSRIDYGRVRLWGSVSFIAASLGVGLVIQQAGAGLVVPLLVGAGALMIAGAYFIPRELGVIQRTGAQEQSGSKRRLRLSDALALMRSPLFLVFLAAASLIHSSHAMLYAFGSLHWKAQGLSGGTIGVLWSIGVVAEVALFAISGRVIGRLGATRLLSIAGILTVMRWSFMAFDPPLWTTVMLQTLHAFSFGAAHLAAIHFLTHAMPEDRSATAQGLYSAVVAGLGMGTATLASGPLYENLGGTAYAVMAVIAACGTVAAMVLSRLWDGAILVGHSEAPEDTLDQPQSSGEGE